MFSLASRLEAASGRAFLAQKWHRKQGGAQRFCAQATPLDVSRSGSPWPLLPGRACRCWPPSQCRPPPFQCLVLGRGWLWRAWLTQGRWMPPFGSRAAFGPGDQPEMDLAGPTEMAVGLQAGLGMDACLLGSASRAAESPGPPGGRCHLPLPHRILSQTKQRSKADHWASWPQVLSVLETSKKEGQGHTRTGFTYVFNPPPPPQFSNNYQRSRKRGRLADIWPFARFLTHK